MRTTKIHKERTVAFQEHQFEQGVCDVLGRKNGLLTLFHLAINNPDLTQAKILCNKIQLSPFIPEKEKGVCIRILNCKILGNSAESQQH